MSKFFLAIMVVALGTLIGLFAFVAITPQVVPIRESVMCQGCLDAGQAIRLFRAAAQPIGRMPRASILASPVRAPSARPPKA
jgi:hypothetical protein